jgi:hypothetical protein
MSHADNFKSWYSDILAGLYSDSEAGFVILMVAFPLLERYLRSKSGDHEERLTCAFYDELRGVFPVLRDTTTAKQFWQVYRNGLLHQVTLSQRDRKMVRMPDGWVSTASPHAIEVDASGNFSVHPKQFANTVIGMITGDFTTFEGKGSRNHALPRPGPPGGATGP